MTTALQPKSYALATFQLIFFSLAGLILFFYPVTIGDKTTILFDHAASYLVKQQRETAIVLMFALMLYGVVRPFVTVGWKESLSRKIMNFVNVVGLFLSVVYIAGVSNDIIMAKGMLPFLFNKLALNVAMIVPVGALALACLVGFGLLEIIGVLFEPIMRPVWKTPGKSAIDAVASFVGSYSIGLLITNRVYQQKQYSTRQAVIIATGFSTVSAAFMVIVAKTLGLMSAWNMFFWSTLIITFLVTAISVRIPPISMMDDNDGDSEDRTITGNRFKAAWDKGIYTAQHTESAAKVIWSNFRDGLNMAATIVPSIIAIGLAGLLLEKYTPVFDWLGYLLVPFTWIGGLENPLQAGSGIATSLAEMFLPALVLRETDILTQYVAGVASISSILFFSAMIPCIMATSIPLSISKIVMIWLQRTALSIVLAAWFGKLAISLGWLVG